MQEDDDINYLTINQRLPAKQRICYCLHIRPSREILLDGALTLKLVTQLCFLLDIFISMSYVTIFIIVHSHVWVFMSLLFTLQFISAIALLADTSYIHLGLPWAYKVKKYLTLSGILSLVIFYLFQKALISGRMRGTTLSIHFVVLKSLFDLFMMYWVWSRYLHEAGDAYRAVESVS